jgi:hypothetical protein
MIFFLDELLDLAAALVSEHGGGGGNEHAPAACLLDCFFFCFLNLITAG